MRGLVLVAVLAGAAGAQVESFREGRREVAGLLERRKWSAATERLDELLAEHTGEDYVRLELADIVEDYRRCAFRAEYEVPEPDELIAGDLVSWNPRTGKIKLRYSAKLEEKKRNRTGRKKPEAERKSTGIPALEELLGASPVASGYRPGDFENVDGVFVHPVHFSGSFTIEIRGGPQGLKGSGSSLNPRPSASPVIYAGIGEEQMLQVAFGAPRRSGINSTTWIPARLALVESGEIEILDEDEPAMKDGKEYRLAMSVKPTTVTATCNGQRILKGKKDRGVFGRVGFRNCNKIDEILLYGEANTSWLESLVDARVRADQERFERTYDPRTDLPAWLHASLDSPRGKAVMAAFPGADNATHAKYAKKLERHLAKKEHEEGLKYLDGLLASEATEAFRLYYLSRLELAKGMPEEALLSAQRVKQLEPDFQRGRLLLAQLLARVGRRDEAADELRALVADDPPSAEPYDQLARLLIRQGETGEATEVIERAIDSGSCSPMELAGVSSILRRTVEGPEWPRRFEHRSKNYRVVSDLGDKVCFEVADVLEDALKMYNRRLQRVPREDEQQRYVVYVFSGQAGYLDYAEDLFGAKPRNTAGLYSPILKQLLIWNLPDRDDMWRTVRHEGFHQYLDRMAEDAPIWLNEGLAEYFETASFSRGRLTDGESIPQHVDLLLGDKTRWASFEDLVRMEPAEFYSNARQHYAQSWALLHYLLQGDPDGLKLFRELFDALLGGATREELGKLLLKGTPDNLEARVRLHLSR